MYSADVMWRLRIFVLGAAFGAVGGWAVPAIAGHYHVTGNYGGTGHALVHGASTTDDVWHGRTTPAQVTGTHWCGAGDEGRGMVLVSSGNGSTTCTATVRADYFYAHSRECYSFGYADYPNVVSAHYHYHHDACTFPT
jgi:hypothetical protein